MRLGQSKERWNRDRYDNTSRYFMFFLAVYGILLCISFVYPESAPKQDLIAAISIISIVFMMHRIIGFSASVPIFLGMGFIPHILGLYNIFSIYGGGGLGNFYGAPQLGYHYDWIVHGFGMFCYSIALSSILFSYLKKSVKKDYFVFIILIFMIVGVGAMNEVFEYVGYEQLGYGTGFLEFGEGDSSPDAGPWQNASMDMVNNFLGASLGIYLFMLARRRSNQKIPIIS